MKERWKVGILEYWKVGILESWNNGKKTYQVSKACGLQNLLGLTICE
jgi:hypothetical protein